jgi:hypothetical protein
LGVSDGVDLCSDLSACRDLCWWRIRSWQMCKGGHGRCCFLLGGCSRSLNGLCLQSALCLGTLFSGSPSLLNGCLSSCMIIRYDRFDNPCSFRCFTSLALVRMGIARILASYSYFHLSVFHMMASFSPYS